MFELRESRFGVYLAPSADSPLWRFGCDVIGRDATTGRRLRGFAPEGYSPEAWRKLTSEPRRYGFHATLKAPFRLRADLDVPDLIDRMGALARGFAPFEAGELTVGAFEAGEGRSFVVLRPVGVCANLKELEAAAVRKLDVLRAPLSQSERARRSVQRLTPRQRYYMDAWGYPYVIDDFRPHFTLTNPIADADSAVRALRREFDFRVSLKTWRVDALTLFVESEPGRDFRVLRRFPLRGSVGGKSRHRRGASAEIVG